MKGLSRTLRTILLIGSLVLLTACTAPALAGGGLAAPVANSPSLPAPESGAATGIVVTGSGTASAEPDLAIISLAVEAISEKVDQAIGDNTERMARVMTEVKTLGFEENDLQTVNYSVWSEQLTDSEGRSTGEMRYHALNELRIRVHDPSATGEVLTVALKAGANRVNGISFGVAEPATLRSQARELAIDDALAKANQLAEGLGARVGELRYVSESEGGTLPGPYLVGGYGGGGGESVPISAGEFSVSVQIQVVFEVLQ